MLASNGPPAPVSQALASVTDTENCVSWGMDSEILTEISIFIYSEHS